MAARRMRRARAAIWCSRRAAPSAAPASRTVVFTSNSPPRRSPSTADGVLLASPSEGGSGAPRRCRSDVLGLLPRRCASVIVPNRELSGESGPPEMREPGGSADRAGPRRGGGPASHRALKPASAPLPVGDCRRPLGADDRRWLQVGRGGVRRGIHDRGEGISRVGLPSSRSLYSKLPSKSCPGVTPRA
jgi:hypothetical protein